MSLFYAENGANINDGLIEFSFYLSRLFGIWDLSYDYEFLQYFSFGSIL